MYLYDIGYIYTSKFRDGQCEMPQSDLASTCIFNNFEVFEFLKSDELVFCV